ncbi:MAG: iron-containing alcohol dehydrogenase [Desulfurococcus sp.]|nr:iron-containing alcohol dehydrogenase [Desulfurococcus sp.]
MSYKWEAEINLENVFTLQPARPVTYFGVGALEKIKDIAGWLKGRGIDSILIVTGKTSYKATGAWDKVRPALEEKGIQYTIFDEVRPNPTYESCDKAAELAREVKAGAVLSIGGGSSHDTAKTVAALLHYPGKTAKELYEKIIVIEKAAPIICINTTHGTGSEVDKFAVAQSDGGYKPAILGAALYPVFSIEDPILTKALPEKQTIATSLDALNHAFEAATTTVRNPYSKELAMTAARLIYKWLPIARREPGNIIARYWLMYASAIAGIAFDIALLHLTHALEHPLSALNPKISHGIGLAALMPSVVKITYRVLPATSADFLRPIIPDLKGEPGEAEHAAVELEKWLASVGSPEKLRDLGFTEQDVEKLTENAMTSPGSPGLFNVAPVSVTRELVRSIYRESLEPLSK